MTEKGGWWARLPWYYRLWAWFMLHPRNEWLYFRWLHWRNGHGGG